MPVPRTVNHSALAIGPLPASLALLSMAVGAAVLIGASTLVLVPLLVGLVMLAAWLVITLLLGWAGIEAMAAFERWLESAPRFQR